MHAAIILHADHQTYRRHPDLVRWNGFRFTSVNKNDPYLIVRPHISVTRNTAVTYAAGTQSAAPGGLDRQPPAMFRDAIKFGDRADNNKTWTAGGGFKGNAAPRRR